MPKPVDSAQRYLPGLDGLRALAVLAVIAYHLQLGWAPGGLLGVGVFFTLSGFLITSLLLGQWQSAGRMPLADFWLRRARRLLPARFVMLAVVTAWVTVADRGRLASLRGAVGAAAMYVSNWYLIAQKQSYFAQFAPPAPLDHLWSLAVEEQFYLLWPLLLIAGLILIRILGVKAHWWLAIPVAALATASAVMMIHLYQPGLDPTRVYEGTDTRAFGLLIGAVLALVWPAGRMREPGRAVRLGLDGAGVAGLAVIGLMIWRVGEYSPFSYRGGMVLLSLATAAVVAATACPGSMVGLALGWRPLRWVGARSYGIYLWHYPVIVLSTPAGAPENLTRAAFQAAAAITLAALSWRFIEEPVRHGAIDRMWRRARQVRRPAPGGVGAAGVSGRRGALGGPGVGAVSGMARFGPVPAVGAANAVARIAAATGAGAVLVLAVAGRAGIAPAGPAPGTAATLGAGSQQLPAGGTSGTGPPAPAPATAGSRATGTASAPAAGSPRTSCRGVAHIGDSTSYGLDSPLYIPDPAQRITARYQDAGVQRVVTAISGGRSVVEVLPGQTNAYDTAKDILRQGFRGCWVLALGTDDSANVAAGSTVGLMTRIQRMMSATAGAPVLWVNVKTLVTSGPYAEPNMERWNAALLQACARYPNLRIFNWAAVVQPDWFISDGIHYTSQGYQVRAKLIATALAQAFPQNGQNRSCVVSG